MADREALQLAVTGEPCLLAGNSRPLLFRTAGVFPPEAAGGFSFIPASTGRNLPAQPDQQRAGVYIC
jgi:hypothetical protein